MPTMRGRRYVAPKSARRPRCDQMAEKRAVSLAMRMSQARHNERPAPTAAPLTAAMVGMGQAMSLAVLA